MNTNFIVLVTDIDIYHTLKLLEKSNLIGTILKAKRLKIWCLLPQHCNKFDINKIQSKIDFLNNKTYKARKTTHNIKIIHKYIFKNRLEFFILKFLGLTKAKYASIRHNSKYKILIVVSFKNYAIYSIPAIHTRTILVTYRDNKDINVKRYNMVKYVSNK